MGYITYLLFKTLSKIEKQNKLNFDIVRKALGVKFDDLVKITLHLSLNVSNKTVARISV
jgi:hypothetical protein